MRLLLTILYLYTTFIMASSQPFYGCQDTDPYHRFVFGCQSGQVICVISAVTGYSTIMLSSNAPCTWSDMNSTSYCPVDISSSVEPCNGNNTCSLDQTGALRGGFSNNPHCLALGGNRVFVNYSCGTNCYTSSQSSSSHTSSITTISLPIPTSKTTTTAALLSLTASRGPTSITTTSQNNVTSTNKYATDLKLPTGAIVGIAIGAFVAVLIVVVILVVCLLRRHRKGQDGVEGNKTNKRNVIPSTRHTIYHPNNNGAGSNETASNDDAVLYADLAPESIPHQLNTGVKSPKDATMQMTDMGVSSNYMLVNRA